jgi:hypothetical protein
MMEGMNMHLVHDRISHIYGVTCVRHCKTDSVEQVRKRRRDLNDS